MDRRTLMILAGLAGLLLLGSGGYMYYENERAKPYLATIQAAAQKYGLDPTLLANQLQAESNFDPMARSPAGALGIAQFEPATAAAYGVDPFNPTQAIYGMAHMMSDLVRQFGDYPTALAAYNYGSGHVTNLVNTYGSDFLAYAPSETQDYVAKVMG